MNCYELDWAGLRDGTIADFDDAAPFLELGADDTIISSKLDVYTEVSNKVPGKDISTRLNNTDNPRFDDWGVMNYHFTEDKVSNNNYKIKVKMGLFWDANGMSITYTLPDFGLTSSIYVDKTEIDEDLKDSTVKSKTIMNQYMYLLIDNQYFTNTQEGSSKSIKSGALNDYSFDIDYVRVYQKEGGRDIVTPETEAFNSNNRFGSREFG